MSPLQVIQLILPYVSPCSPLSGLDPILGEHLSGSPIAFAVFVQSLSRLDQSLIELPRALCFCHDLHPGCPSQC